MPYYYYILIITLSLLVFLVIRFSLSRKKNLSDELFVEALRTENDGHFEEAVIIYQTALDEFGKVNTNNILKNKIIEKLKLLNTVIEYNKSTNFIR